MAKSNKLVKYAIYAGVAVLAMKAIQSGGLKGLADDLTNDIPSDIDVPFMGYPGGYPYFGGYPGYYPNAAAAYPGYTYPYSPYGYPGYSYGLPTPPAPGYQFNPYGGGSYYGMYIPKVVTPSGGIQGV